MQGDGLKGTHRVRLLRPVFDEGRRMLPKWRDRMEARAQVLKLAYWPQTHPTTDEGRLLDVDWCWVRALRDLRVGELRIDDVIGGKDNLRAVFFADDRKGFKPLPVIWVLWFMQKKRDDWTSHDLGIMKARRCMALERFTPDGT